MRTFSATFAGETDYIFVGALDATGSGNQPPQRSGATSVALISDGLHAGVAKDHLSEGLSEGSVCPGGFTVAHAIFNPAKRRQAFCVPKALTRSRGVQPTSPLPAEFLLQAATAKDA
jgi:hypothetical protein